MAMAVAINTSFLALDLIPNMQRELERVRGGGRRFQIHRVSVHATIVSHDSEIGQQLYSMLNDARDPMLERLSALLAKREALNWQDDPDDDVGDLAVLHHLHQQAATVPLLSSVFSQSHQGHAATTLTGSALSASIHARTQGRLLSSFHRHSYRESILELGVPINNLISTALESNLTTVFPNGRQDYRPFASLFLVTRIPCNPIVWAGPQRDTPRVFWQVQVDVVDLYSPRLPTSRTRQQRRTAVNQFLQVSHSPVGEDTSRGNPLPHAKTFNGVRYRPDRQIYVAEMKPRKHKTKQDFGNFKSEDEAARAVDAAFYHYGRPELLNFPHTSRQFLSTRPTAPAGLDEKAKVKFVKEEAKLLLAATAASSPLHSTHTNSLQSLEPWASPRRCPSGPFRSFSEISSPFSCSGPDEFEAVVSQPEPLLHQAFIWDISPTAVLTNLETLNPVRNAEEGWDRAEDSCTLAAPPYVGIPIADESPSMWLDSIIGSSPAPTYPRSPCPSHSDEEFVNTLVAHQSI